MYISQVREAFRDAYSKVGTDINSENGFSAFVRV